MIYVEEGNVCESGGSSFIFYLLSFFPPSLYQKLITIRKPMHGAQISLHTYANKIKQ